MQNMRLGVEIGRLAEAASRSPAAVPWSLREAAVAAASLTSSDWERLDAGDLFVAAFDGGIDDPNVWRAARTGLGTWRFLLQVWFERDVAMSPWGLEAEDEPDEREAADERRARTLTIRDLASAIATAAGGDMVAALREVHRMQGVASRSELADLAIAVPLGLRETLGTVLPCMTTILTDPGSNTALVGPVSASDRDFDVWSKRRAPLWIVAITEARARLAASERTLRLWQEVRPASRSHSKLGEVMDVVACAPAITPAGVASAVGMTPQAAGRHLSTLERLGLVEEVTGSRRWRVFTTKDLSEEAAAATAKRRTVPTAEPTTFPIATLQPLGDDIADFDDALQRATDRVGRVLSNA